MTKHITISMLTAILSLPAFAEIANNATCNNTNLGQSDNNSTANVEANWNANTININWYNGDTKITSNTCTYDGAITLPAEPTKPGYTFAGWKLKTTKILIENLESCSSINNQQDCINSYIVIPNCMEGEDFEVHCVWTNNSCGKPFSIPNCHGGGSN